jgi:hypothetical protein
LKAVGLIGAPSPPVKLDLNNKNRAADVQRDMLIAKDDLLELARFYTNSQ